MSPLPPGIVALSWILGTWQGRTEENWLVVGDTLVGVAFTPGDDRTRFEILRIDFYDGALRLRAEPGPGPSSTFPAVAAPAGSARFEAPAHDFPQWITYRSPSPRRLEAAIGKLGERAAMSWRWRSRPPRAAPELEAADRAFAAAVAAGGMDAWSAWFDPEGIVWAEGPYPLGDAMDAVVAPGLVSGLSWTPIEGRHAPGGDLGFTVGTWTSADGAGHYLTIWARQPDGGWKVLWDQRV